MGFFRSISKGIGKAYNWIIQDEARLRAAKHPGYISPHLENDDSKPKYLAENIDPWEEVDNIQSNFFLGGWATRKFKVTGEDKVKKELEDLAKKRAIDEGHEYKSSMQSELEAVGRKREEKARLKEEKRRQKKAGM